MRVLVIGSGGREHALCWAIAASPLCDKLYCAPGNGGIAQIATCAPIEPAHTAAIIQLCRDEKIDFVVVGPEAPLVAGLVDRLEAEGIRAFGPRANAALLEGSKGFMRDFCAKHGIPTPAYRRFTKLEDARAFILQQGAPIVVKADGLAAGKGVTVAATVEDALSAAEDMMGRRRFGEAGDEVIVETCLEGREVSVFALVDGDHILELASAQDYKRVGDGDSGPNTGGMGAISPAPIMTAELNEQIMAQVMRPTVAGMAAEGRPFRGVLYAGLMITADGPQVLEYNVRFGDPECQVLVPRLMSDLLPALIAACDGELEHFDLRWRPEEAICVVMATNGYPGSYETGSVIGNLETAETDEAVTIFHAGTDLRNGQIVATGGRVLGVTARASSIVDARGKAYAAVDKIDWPDGFCRRDIGAAAADR